MNREFIRISLNEILFYFTRAGFGVNAPIGLSEDFARSNVWLAENGFDPSSCSYFALDCLDNSKSSLIAKFSDSNTIVCGNKKYLSAFQASVVAADWVSTNSKDGLNIINVDSPFLVLAQLGAILAENWQIEWSDDEGDEYLVKLNKNEKWEIVSNSVSQIEHSKGANISIRKSIHTDIDNDVTINKFDTKCGRKNILQTGVEVKDRWGLVYEYFSRCLVKSNTRSRESGAGAGLVDND
ncbi:MAG: hypothetical protein VCA13_06240 [PS1 clade bacterium]|jgi:hypothetical protein